MFDKFDKDFSIEGYMSALVTLCVDGSFLHNSFFLKDKSCNLDWYFLSTLTEEEIKNLQMNVAGYRMGEILYKDPKLKKYGEWMLFVHGNYLRCFDVKKTIFECDIELKGLKKDSEAYIRVSRRRENAVNRLNKLERKIEAYDESHKKMQMFIVNNPESYISSSVLSLEVPKGDGKYEEKKYDRLYRPSLLDFAVAKEIGSDNARRICENVKRKIESKFEDKIDYLDERSREEEFRHDSYNVSPESISVEKNIDKEIAEIVSKYLDVKPDFLDASIGSYLGIPDFGMPSITKDNKVENLKKEKEELEAYIEKLELVIKNRFSEYVTLRGEKLFFYDSDTLPPDITINYTDQKQVDEIQDRINYCKGRIFHIDKLIKLIRAREELVSSALLGARIRFYNLSKLQEVMTRVSGEYRRLNELLKADKMQVSVEEVDSLFKDEKRGKK